MRAVGTFLALGLAAAAVGCVPLGMVFAPPAVERLDVAEAMLAESALRAETALTTLARIEASANPAAAAPIPRIVPPALLRRISLDWSGPLETAVALLARSAEYAFAVAGAAPARPVLVELRAERVPLIILLRDAGLQAGAAAALTVDPERRQVQIDWAPFAGGRGT